MTTSATTTATVTADDAGRPAGMTRTLAGVAGLAATAACLVYLAGVVFLSGSLSDRESSLHPMVIVPDVIAAFAFIALAVTLPVLAETVRLPRWPAYLSAAGLAFMAAISWVGATFEPHVAGLVSNAQVTQFNNHGDGYMDLFGYPKIALCVVGFIALGVFCWRRRAVSRVTAVLLVIAGLLSVLGAAPWPAGIPAGLAIAWLAWRPGGTPSAES